MYTAMKIIHVPLLDQNWVDFSTGKVNEEAVRERDSKFDLMMEKQLKKAKEFMNNTNENWEVFVTWLWWVK